MLEKFSYRQIPSDASTQESESDIGSTDHLRRNRTTSRYLTAIGAFELVLFVLILGFWTSNLKGPKIILKDVTGVIPECSSSPA